MVSERKGLFKCMDCGKEMGAEEVDEHYLSCDIVCAVVMSQEEYVSFLEDSVVRRVK